MSYDVGVRVKAQHPWAYRPNGCEYATITHIGWDEETQRIQVGLLFDNGVVDWIPFSEFGPPVQAYVEAEA